MLMLKLALAVDRKTMMLQLVMLMLKHSIPEVHM
jgi:hypothetical protein